mgnify:CR=1 FL=1
MKTTEENTEYICYCNNCCNYLYDENPNLDATKFAPSSFNKPILPMELLNEEGDSFWGCGNCQTDAYLIDIETMKTTEQNNRMIAEFMGLNLIVQTDGVSFKDNNTGLFHELKYHTSWDWIMPAVSKCRTLSNADNELWESVYYSLE